MRPEAPWWWFKEGVGFHYPERGRERGGEEACHTSEEGKRGSRTRWMESGEEGKPGADLPPQPPPPPWTLGVNFPCHVKYIM